ncbi:MAG: hypothetical protein JRI45_05895 [Deltaproteobacteria bacterium]|nr:hypothetical protein [Deltaproteobacteria bacterium]MBW2069055.1 hypothetical protein [Deltaproteobacteria bacterium]RLB60566.1 MAG: hypothetical protein DRH08_15205 [Deltaproteobacteria bacterium]
MSDTLLQEENRKIRKLQFLVDFALAYIAQSPVSLEECHRVVEGVRQFAYNLFPDKKETFELIYVPRFRRLIAEKYHLD